MQQDTETVVLCRRYSWHVNSVLSFFTVHSSLEVTLQAPFSTCVAILCLC